MAGCGPGCANERKTVTKELHRWSKNLLHMVGLECVIKKFVDRKMWHSISPFIKEEKKGAVTGDLPKDWVQGDPCRICARKTRLQKELEKSIPMGRKGPSSSGYNTNGQVTQSQTSSVASVAPQTGQSRSSGGNRGAAVIGQTNENVTKQSSATSKEHKTKETATAATGYPCHNVGMATVDTAGGEMSTEFKLDQLFSGIHARDMFTAGYGSYDNASLYLTQLLSWYQQNQASSASSMAAFYSQLFGNQVLPYLMNSEMLASQTGYNQLQNMAVYQQLAAYYRLAQGFNCSDPALAAVSGSGSSAVHSFDLSQLSSLGTVDMLSAMQQPASASGTISENAAVTNLSLSAMDTVTTQPTYYNQDSPLDLTKKQRHEKQHQGTRAACENAKTVDQHGSVITELTNGRSSKHHRSSETTSPAGSVISFVQGKNGLSSNGSAQKRNYSQADLDAAVQDIRSGRLGTRRASVVYGIPRSTLRNKVYKLETSADQMGSKCQLTPSPVAAKKSKSSLKDAVDFSGIVSDGGGADFLYSLGVCGDGSSAAGSEMLRQMFQYYSTAAGDGVFGGTNGSNGSLPWSAHLAQLATAASRCPSAATSDTDGVTEKILTQISNKLLVQKCEEVKQHATAKPLASRSATEKSQLDFKNLGKTFEKTNQVEFLVNCVLRKSLFHRLAEGSDEDEKEKSSQMLIAEQLPECPSEPSSPSVLNLESGVQPSLDDLKREQAIENSVSQIMMTISAMGGGERSGRIKRKSSGGKRHKSRRSTASAAAENCQQESADGGGSGSDSDKNKLLARPKRGQYRKYDKAALAEAVRSVRRGEMSVHRAGSFYGVPHSTLEYKVKERNLMRPKKRDQKCNISSVTSSGIGSAVVISDATVHSSIEKQSNCSSTVSMHSGEYSPPDSQHADNSENSSMAGDLSATRRSSSPSEPTANLMMTTDDPQLPTTATSTKNTESETPASNNVALPVPLQCSAPDVTNPLLLAGWPYTASFVDSGITATAIESESMSPNSTEDVV